MNARAAFDGKGQVRGAKFFPHQLPPPDCSGRKTAGTAYRPTDKRKGVIPSPSVSPRSR